MENKNHQSKLYWVYLSGFFLILCLPIINIPPWFFPPDWGKTIIFRVIFSLLLSFFVYQIIFKKGVSFNINWTTLKNKASPVFWPFWLLISLLVIYFLATIFSVNPSFSFWGSPERGGGFLNFALCGLFGVFVFFILRNSDWQKIWDFSFIIAGLVSLIAILQQFGVFSGFLVITSRPYATIGNVILLAIYLLLLIFITLSFGIKAKNIYKKIFYFSLFSLFIFVIIISITRSVYLGVTVGFLYFLFFYPKKLPLLKLTALGFLILTVFSVYYINTHKKFPPVLQNNKLFQVVAPRLSWQLFINDPRFSAWQVAIEALKNRPALGYGPENFQIGFDKYYTPSLPYIAKNWGDWYDRAHNFILDIGVTAGIPALMVYLSLVVILFWQLHKLKSADKNADGNAEKALMAHGIQAALIGYLVADFFSFDNFVTYLMFFLLIGYSLFLINENSINKNIASEPAPTKTQGQRPSALPSVLICVLLIVLIWFVWFYNIKPLKINGEIQIATNEADNNLCDSALPRMDKLLSEHTFLDSYLRLEYVSVINKCINEEPKSTIELSQKAISALKENVKTIPSYTRNWYFLGIYTNVLIEMNFAKDDPKIINDLKNQADYYFTKSLELSPRRQEIFLEWSKTYLLLKDYQTAISKAKTCIELNPNLGDCYWSLAIAEIFSGDIKKGNDDVALAEEKNFPINFFVPSNQLLAAYQSVLNYEGMAKVYENLIKLRTSEVQYYASLAAVYKELKDYPNARAMAEMVLELAPDDQTKKEVMMFLNTLP
jgi:putative inorganic carbon (HCO3(-)) transporter